MRCVFSWLATQIVSVSSEKAHRRGEHGSPGTPLTPTALRATSSVEEPKEKSPLIEEMPDRAEESFAFFERSRASDNPPVS